MGAAIRFAGACVALLTLALAIGACRALFETRPGTAPSIATEPTLAAATPTPEPTASSPTPADPLIVMTAAVAGFDANRPWAMSGPAGVVIGGPDLTSPGWEATGSEAVRSVTREYVVTTERRGSGMTLRARDIATGATVTSVETGGRWYRVAPAGDGRFLLSGYLPTAAPSDPGLVLFDARDGQLEQLVAPQPPADKDGDVYRHTLVDAAGVFVTALCSAAGCQISEVNPKDGSTVPLMRSERPPIFATRSMLIFGDGTGSTYRGVSRATGKDAWTLKDAEFQDAYLTSDGRIVVAYIDHRDGWQFKIAYLDPDSGKRDVRWVSPVDQNREIWADLSDDRYVVIGEDDEGSALEEGEGRASILDLEAGQLFDGALVITPTAAK